MGKGRTVVRWRESDELFPPDFALLLVLPPSVAIGADVVLNLLDVLVSEVKLQKAVLHLAVRADHLERSYVVVAAYTLFFALGEGHQMPLQTLHVEHVLFMASHLYSRAKGVGRDLRELRRFRFF